MPMLPPPASRLTRILVQLVLAVLLSSGIPGAQAAVRAPRARPRPAASAAQAAAAPQDYYLRPLYQIGIPGRPTVAQVAPEGFLNTGYFEAGFYTGFEMRPIEGIRLTPSPDGLPRVLGRLDREGLRYDFEYFAAPLVLGPAAPPEVDVVRVKITNGDS